MAVTQAPDELLFHNKKSVGPASSTSGILCPVLIIREWLQVTVSARTPTAWSTPFQRGRSYCPATAQPHKRLGLSVGVPSCEPPTGGLVLAPWRAQANARRSVTVGGLRRYCSSMTGWCSFLERLGEMSASRMYLVLLLGPHTCACWCWYMIPIRSSELT